MSSPLVYADPARPKPLRSLTRRQRQCLLLASRGMSSRRIGDHLGLSVRTVDEHLARACAALGVRTRVQAVARFAASGWSARRGRFDA
jgi:DNA-binding CsgD family transcriptional regulator